MPGVGALVVERCSECAERNVISLICSRESVEWSKSFDGCDVLRCGD